MFLAAMISSTKYWIRKINCQWMSVKRIRWGEQSNLQYLQGIQEFRVHEMSWTKGIPGIITAESPINLRPIVVFTGVVIMKLVRNPSKNAWVDKCLLSLAVLHWFPVLFSFMATCIHLWHYHSLSDLLEAKDMISCWLSILHQLRMPLNRNELSRGLIYTGESQTNWPTKLN